MTLKRDIPLSVNNIAERAPWADFPPVIRNGELGSLKNEPDYEAAKHGRNSCVLARLCGK